MGLAFLETSRGSGKIYIHVQCGDVPSGARVVASSSLESGKEMPSKLVTCRGVDGKVLILPVLNVAQKVAMRLVDESGAVISEISKTITPLGAKLSSRKNTALKNPVANAIRNCDELYPDETADVRIIRISFDYKANDDFLYILASFRAPSEEAVSAPIEMRVLDLDGNPCNKSVAFDMGNKVRRSKAFEGYWVREQMYSVRISESTPAVILWAKSSSPEIPDALTCNLPYSLGRIRSDWRAWTLPADNNPAYADWYARFGRASEDELALERKREFVDSPLFSIVVPLFNTPSDFFRDMADSVLAQTYAKFELILVNASPDNVELSKLVKEYADRDSRVKVIDLAENGGITENTNEGIRHSSGDFLCFLDHDDLIEPDTLYRYASEIVSDPETDLLYCDEDKYLNGSFTNPFLKPEWNLDRLLSQNYVCHFLSVRKSIVDSMPLSTNEVNGAQDQDLTIRVGEKARRICHVSRVLYHWRMHEGSTSCNDKAKQYTSDGGIAAVQAHFDRLGIPAKVSEQDGVPNGYRVRYLLDEEPLVSIVIPNMDQADVLKRCIDSILEKTTYSNFEIVIVENNSVERRTFDYYEELQRADSRIRVTTCEMSGEFNFSHIANVGCEAARGDFYLLLNNDTEVVEPEWLSLMTGCCSRADVGIVGAKLLFPDDTIQHAGISIYPLGPFLLSRQCHKDDDRYFHAIQLTQDMMAVTGACLMTKASVFSEAGGFDERFAVDYNDVDYCFKVYDKGHLVVYEPNVVLRHYESVSRGTNDTPEKQVRFTKEKGLLMEKWPSFFALSDEYGNPNIIRDPYSLNMEPRRDSR